MHIILSALLFGCRIYRLILSKEHVLRYPDNRGECLDVGGRIKRKVNNYEKEELNNFYSTIHQAVDEIKEEAVGGTRNTFGYDQKYIRNCIPET